MTEPLPATLTTQGDATAVRIRVDLPATPEDVWPFLVDPELTQRWSPVVPDRSLDTPGPALSSENPGEDPVSCDVLVVEEPTLLQHRWGPDVVAWQLVALPLESGDQADAGDSQARGTRLLVEQATSTPEMAASLAAGWSICLDTLRRLLTGEGAPRLVGQDALAAGWAELDEHYRRQFGAGDAPGE